MMMLPNDKYAHISGFLLSHKLASCKASSASCIWSNLKHDIPRVRVSRGNVRVRVDRVSVSMVSVRVRVSMVSVRVRVRVSSSSSSSSSRCSSSSSSSIPISKKMLLEYV